MHVSLFSCVQPPTRKWFIAAQKRLGACRRAGLRADRRARRTVGPVRSGPVRSGPVRSGPVRSGPVRSGGRVGGWSGGWAYGWSGGWSGGWAGLQASGHVYTRARARASAVPCHPVRAVPCRALPCCAMPCVGVCVRACRCVQVRVCGSVHAGACVRACVRACIRIQGKICGKMRSLWQGAGRATGAVR